MSIEINIGGTWKTIDTASINVGGTWKTPDSIEINVGGTWKTVWPTGPTVDMTYVVSNSTVNPSGTCYANVRIGSDGNYYKSDYGGAFGTSYGAWLSSGSTSEVWVARTVTAGTLSTDGIGSGRVVCSTNRDIGVTRIAAGLKTATVTLYFWDAATGGTLLDSKSITLTALNDS